MAYTYEQVFAADPSNPSNVAQNASITIFAPGDGTMTPLTITDPDGQPLNNPIPVNANGFGSAFAHATLDRVAWAGGGFTGFFTSYEGMKGEAVAARAAAETAAATAGADAAAVATAAIGSAVEDAATASDAAVIAASSATAAAAAAASSAALVGAPADVAIAAAVAGAGETKTALNAAISDGITPIELAQAQRIALDRAGQSDRQAAQGAARIAFEDSTAYHEAWANLTGWTVGASTVTVAAGQLRGATQAAGVGISRGINVSAGFRAKGVINNVPGGSVSESAMIGVSKTAPGATWVAGDRMAIGFTASGNLIGYEGTNLPGGTGSTTLLASAPSGAYGWTIDVDSENVSITITTPAGVSYRRRRLLANFGGTVQTLVINNNDARAASGITINGFGYRESHASLKPVSLEATGYRAEILGYGLGTAQEYRVILPNGYDSRKPLPFVISAHGNTQDEEHFSLSAERQALATAIIGAGYGYASHLMHGNNWGSPDGVDDLRKLYLYLKANYPLGPVVLLGESMGGLASWSAAARKTIPLAGLGLIDGVANLKWNWDNGTDGTTLDRTRIIASYGIAGDGSDYATKTAGYDPALQPAEAFTGVPIQITASGSDSRIPMAFHGRLMSDKLTGHADVTLIEHTGPHTDGTAFATSMWMPFIARCVGTA